MKTLKFMLAAATAIGLASATQAAVNMDASTGLEEFAQGTPVTTGTKPDSSQSSYFYYAGGTAADNESVIAAAGDMTGVTRPLHANKVTTDQANILQVSTGTDPLIRTRLNLTSSGGELVPQSDNSITADTYVDTLVQFTVTPYSDPVTPSAADKLMIYLKECTNDVGTVTGTNLVVVGGCVVGANDESAAVQEYVVEGFHVAGTTETCHFEPGTWYRLTVEAIVNVGRQGGSNTYPGFRVYVDGKLCYYDVAAWNEGNRNFVRDGEYYNANQSKELVLSILANGSTAASLMGVGFAGEGKVDDIVFDSDPFGESVIDFTLAWPNGYSPVSYTVGAGSAQSLSGETSPFHIPNGVEDGVTVGFLFQNADGAQKLVTVSAAEGATEGIDAQDATFEWADYLGAAVDGAYQIDDANDLVLLSKGVFSGLATSGETFKQTANINMTGVTGFYGIGWFDASTSFASVPAGVASDGKTTLPFAGTYDGQGYTISNVTIVRHNYAGVFNNVSGTVRNLTVQDIGFSGTCGEWGCAIVGNAASGALLENLTAVTSSGFNWGDSANHNVAGIVVRPIGAATIRGCVNNADISATAKRLGGIAAFVGSGSTGTVFDSCTNNAALVSTDGTRGVGGILGCAEGNTTETATYIRNCVDFGSETAQNANGHAGAIVGSNWNGSYTYTDDGGNTFKASTVDCGYVKNAVFGRAYAVASTIDGTDYLTTVKAADLAAGGTYTLLQDVAAGTVFTLQAAGDTIAFDTNGYTFAGTVDSDAALVVSSATAGTVTTYTAATAVAKVGATKYATLADAVAAANAGDTVEVLADCTVAASVSFTKNVTVSNDYTIAANVNYALCIGATVTFEGSGMIQRGSTISGSAFCVGANETTRGAITAGTAGTLVFNGGTVCGGSGGNQIKLENGTVEMNGGVLKDGLRGIKADADKGSYTSTIVINGGTITNCSAYAVYASAESATGTATITINGGVIAGPIGKAGQVGTESLTIPGTSTAKFDRDQSAFCASGYETTLSDGWYVVTAVQSAGWVDDSSTVSNQTAGAAYPALAESALATADAQKLTDWAKANSIAFNDVTAAPATYEEAFLLNCAVADVAQEKEEFVLDISVAADGTITVSLPEGKNYNGKLQMKGSTDLTTWTNVSETSSTYKFYKYELSL